MKSLPIFTINIAQSEKNFYLCSAIGAGMKEDQHTEFKRNWRDDFLKELCAFANSQGD